MADSPLKIGLIGLDTSHVVAFTEVLNNPENKEHVPGAKVVAAFKGGSPDIEASATRIDGYTKQLTEKYGVKIFPTIDELCREVDAVLLESVDGRPHLEQVRPVIQAHRPVFIDKPVAGSLKDAITIFKLARDAHVPCFTSSSYRFYDSLETLKKTDVGDIKGAISYGPSQLEPHHPDFFWYGIHPTRRRCLQSRYTRTAHRRYVSADIRWCRRPAPYCQCCHRSAVGAAS